MRFSLMFMAWAVVSFAFAQPLFQLDTVFQANFKPSKPLQQISINGDQSAFVLLADSFSFQKIDFDQQGNLKTEQKLPTVLQHPSDSLLFLVKDYFAHDGKLFVHFLSSKNTNSLVEVHFNAGRLGIKEWINLPEEIAHKPILSFDIEKGDIWIACAEENGKSTVHKIDFQGNLLWWQGLSGTAKQVYGQPSGGAVFVSEYKDKLIDKMLTRLDFFDKDGRKKWFRILGNAESDNYIDDIIEWQDGNFLMAARENDDFRLAILDAKQEELSKQLLQSKNALRSALAQVGEKTLWLLTNANGQLTCLNVKKNIVAEPKEIKVEARLLAPDSNEIYKPIPVKKISKSIVYQDVFPIGQTLQISLNSDAPLWYYIVNRDPSDSVKLLFSTKEARSGKLLLPEEGKNIIMKKQGTEHIGLLMSAKPIAVDELNKHISALLNGNENIVLDGLKTNNINSSDGQSIFVQFSEMEIAMLKFQFDIKK